MPFQLLHRSTNTLQPWIREDQQIPVGLDRATFYVVDVIQLDQPALQPGQQAIPADPVIVITDPDSQGINGTVTLGWQVVSPPPPPPEPDWDRLRLGLQTQNGFDQAFRAAFQASPMVGTSLSSRLDAFQLGGNYSLFLQGLQSALSLLPAQEAAHIAIEFLALSQACNMPSDFLEALQNLLEPPTP
jgi:hypothetical protein